MNSLCCSTNGLTFACGSKVISREESNLRPAALANFCVSRCFARATRAKRYALSQCVSSASIVSAPRARLRTRETAPCRLVFFELNIHYCNKLLLNCSKYSQLFLTLSGQKRKGGKGLHTNYNYIQLSLLQHQLLTLTETEVSISSARCLKIVLTKTINLG